MEFSIKASAPDKLKTGALVIPAFSDGKLGVQGQAIDAASGGKLAALIARDLDEDAGELLTMPGIPGIAAERIAVVSLGKHEEFGDKAMHEALAAVSQWLADSRATSAALCATDFVIGARDLPWTLRTAAQALANATYKYDPPYGKKDSKSARHIAKVDMLLIGKSDNTSQTALAQGAAIAAGMALTRQLGDLPANYCTPSHLADAARKLGKDYKLKVEVFDRAGIEKLGMGSFLSVTRGSQEEPRFIVLQYNGGKGKEAPIVLVGKGVTFDSGGISLKDDDDMDEMKYDMCGAGSVLGTLRAVAELGLPLNVVGLIPATENLPSGTATKPGDVVTSMSGQTIEILNTDAEGRLILCDALTYAERFKPAAVIDIATLTGSCVVALGHHLSGLYANDDPLARELYDIGQNSSDRVWQLPIWEDYQSQLKSSFADMSNIGGRPGGSITAACFLSRFTKAYKWAHLDIAGTAWKSGDEKGATGRPVPLLTQFLIKRANA